MNDELVRIWADADGVFDRLLDVEPAARATALARMSLAPAVEQRVQQLMLAHSRSAGVLEAAHGDPLQGRQVGRWVLEQEIGRGGMAVVYRAHSAAGPQLAAVKLLQLGALAAAGVERFRREQAILARLRHAHIASLFDAGVAPDGTPWLAMSLVEGERIDRWCEQRQLSTRAVVTLFLDVCEAVAYAHRNLVVHRDLKPSNLLVDAEGHVRLLDFGIARLLDDADASEATRTQWRALTPQYAAPEQFRGEEATTATDVFGLGALLYQLLVGRPPRAQDAAPTQPVTLPSRAAREPIVARTPSRTRELAGDLDTILLKALAAEPAHRYASADAFADDLRAWLEQRPVAARAPRLGYRVGKWLQRHRELAAVSVLLLCALAGGIATTLWQAHAAREAAQRSEHVRNFLDEALIELVPETASAAAQADRRAMLDRLADKAARSFAGQPLAHADVQARLMQLYEQIGALDAAHAQAAASLATLRRHLPPQHVDIAMRQAEEALLAHRLAKGHDATEAALLETRVRDAVAVLERGGDPGKLANGLLHYSIFLGDSDRRVEALASAQRARGLAAGTNDVALQDSIDTRIGSLLFDTSRYPEAVVHYRELLQRVRERRGEHSAEAAYVMLGLGSSLSNAGERDAGAQMMVQAIAQLDAIYPEGNLRLLNWLQRAANALSRAGQPDAALALAERNVADARRMLGETNVQTGSALVAQGRALLRLRKLAAAEARLREGLHVYQQVFGEQGSFVAAAHHYLANTLAMSDRAAEALAEDERALALLSQAQESGLQARVLDGRGNDYFLLGRYAEAVQDHRRALSDTERRNDRSADGDLVRIHLAEALLHLDQAAEALRLLDQAEASLKEQGKGAEQLLWHVALVRAEQACAGRAADCVDRARTLRSRQMALPPWPHLLRRLEALPR